MIDVTLSDAEAYAVSVAISKFISEHSNQDKPTSEVMHLADISNRLYEYSSDVLSRWDKVDIEKSIGYR